MWAAGPVGQAEAALLDPSSHSGLATSHENKHGQVAKVLCLGFLMSECKAVKSTKNND